MTKKKKIIRLALSSGREWSWSIPGHVSWVTTRGEWAVRNEGDLDLENRVDLTTFVVRT